MDSFHGIIDIFTHLFMLPIYSIVLFLLFIPSNYINYLIIPLTIEHFSKDNIYLSFNYPIIASFLLLGLYYKIY